MVSVAVREPFTIESSMGVSVTVAVGEPAAKFTVVAMVCYAEPFPAVPDIEMVTASAAVVSPDRVSVNVPVPGPASDALLSVAVTETSDRHGFVPAFADERVT
jgi:hypothetical protein